MLKPINTLKNQRVISIDAFRGITFLIMIIVNELASVSGISVWLKHMPADADAMSFPDIVFPAFLFIVGMSIPFGINHRIAQAQTRWQLNVHIFLRALALIIMGLFMVNAESGYHQASMPISIQAWSLLSYLAFLLIWGVYQFKHVLINRILTATGVMLLVVLALIYQGGENGTQNMTPQWWGILGLIGWAYLISCGIYQLCRGQQKLLLFSVFICTAFYVLVHSTYFAHFIENNHAIASLLKIIARLDGHAAHSSIVLLGVICTLIFFEEDSTISHSKSESKSEPRRFINAAILFMILILAATALRPDFKISKIYATPSWCFYSAAICIAVFGFLFWLIDLRKIQNWMIAIKPAAINPLVCYLLPFAIEAILQLGGIQSPLRRFEAGMGIFAALFYSLLIMFSVHGLNKINFRIKF
jgi:predicted acyltransferase